MKKLKRGKRNTRWHKRPHDGVKVQNKRKYIKSNRRKSLQARAIHRRRWGRW